MVEKAGVFDTNVLIYALSGNNPLAREALRSFGPQGIAISYITRIELLTKVQPEDVFATQELIRRCEVVYSTPEIADLAIHFRQQHRLKTPDALIYATAVSMNRLLITFNTKDFNSGMPQIYIPS